jgi:hypothetical protein
MHHGKVMTNGDKKENLQQDQNVKSAQYENTPQNIIYNAARFNKQFLDSQLGGNPVTISIGRMLTVLSEQDNTIRVLSRILGRDYNEQHLHDMHNSLFGDPALGGHSIGREGMDMGNLLNQLTTFIHQQNQQIQALIEEIRKNVKQINDQMQSL